MAAGYSSSGAPEDIHVLINLYVLRRVEQAEYVAVRGRKETYQQFCLERGC
jgi:hypothetical protein